MDIVIHNNQWHWGNTLTIIRYDGMASVELQCDNRYPTIAFIKELIVHDTCRNQGIGDKMLDACFSEAIKLNKLFLQLNVLKDSWLVGWYERKGFTIIYEDDNEYTMWKQLDLNPQKHWKPSDEQIEVLDEVIRNPHLSTAEYNGLIALREQLKALYMI